MRNFERTGKINIITSANKTVEEVHADVNEQFDVISSKLLAEFDIASGRTVVPDDQRSFQMDIKVFVPHGPLSRNALVHAIEAHRSSILSEVHMGLFNERIDGLNRPVVESKGFNIAAGVGSTINNVINGDWPISDGETPEQYAALITAKLLEASDLTREDISIEAHGTVLSPRLFNVSVWDKVIQLNQKRDTIDKREFHEILVVIVVEAFKRYVYGKTGTTPEQMKQLLEFLARYAITTDGDSIFSGVGADFKTMISESALVNLIRK